MSELPIGPVVDATGCIWVGLFGGWGVKRYSPRGEPLSNVVRAPLAS